MLVPVAFPRSRPYPTEISFDIDLRELRGRQGVDALCTFLHTIGSRLGKLVLMTPEGGSQEHPVLGYGPTLGKVTLRGISVLGEADTGVRKLRA
jgi:hypothetical protein